MTKRIAKFLTSDSAKNTEDESRNAKGTAPLEAIGDEAALEEAEARADDKFYAPLGADAFGMPIQPTPKPVVATESEATSVPAEPVNGALEPEPSTVLATKVKAAKAKKEKEKEKKPAKTVEPKADTATLFANFKAAKMVNPFRETVRDFKRYAEIVSAEKLEDIPTGDGKTFRDEKDLRTFISWIGRGCPGYKK